MQSSQFDVVVVGCGIAGLNAGLASARRGRSTLVLAGGMLGGQLLSINKIDGFPGFPDGVPGYDLCPMAQEQAVAAGAEFAATELTRLAPHEGQWRIATGAGQDYVARGVILATGAELKELGVSGEARLRGKGVSHCASCDAPLLRNRVVGVVGGGDSAAQEALTLAEAASRVVVFHRGDALTAQAAYRDPLTQHPRIELRLNTVVEEIIGEASVSAVRTRDRVTGAGGNLDLAGLFIYIGMQPNTGFLDRQVALDATGRIETDGAMRTRLRGLCAAGAVRSGWLGRAVISAGEGAAAALAIDRYLADDRWPDR
jgi:thioredoxin reductase (NADPH)